MSFATSGICRLRHGVFLDRFKQKSYTYKHIKSSLVNLRTLALIQIMADALEPESETDILKPVKEIPVVQDQGIFKHDTGDIYDGFFEAKKKDRSVKMHGPGVYTTAEGDAYSGTWDADRLGANDNVTINYSDGSKYVGQFRDWSYSGRGRYYYPDESVLGGEFAENAPTGHMTLIDPNGHIWLGKAEQGYGWFEPVNHFYEMLEKSKESKIKKQRKEIESGVRSTIETESNR